MILIDMEKPKSCFDCRFRTDTGECELTGLYTSHKAYVMPLSYDCPIVTEIPKDMTNGDVWLKMYGEEAIDITNGKVYVERAFFPFDEAWWNAPWSAPWKEAEDTD